MQGVLLIAQTPETPMQEDILPDADPLKVDRFNVEFLLVEGMHFLAIDNQAKALDSFIKAHQIMPENAAVNFKIAKILHQSSDSDQALFYISKATEKEKENYYYQALKAEILTDKGDLKNAISTYEDLYRFSEDAPDDYLLELAALYLYSDNPDMALETYDRIEKRLGILEEVSTQKQKIYLKQNKLKEAIAEGKRLVEAYPKISEYAVSVAQILVSNNKNEEALNYLKNYLEEHPNQALVEMELAKLYRQSNETILALKHFEKAFQSEEIPLEAKLNNFVALIQKLSQGDEVEKLKALGSSILEIHSTDANAFAANGDLYFALNQKDSAKYFYEKAVTLNGDNLQLWQNLLSLEMENKKYKKVVKYADEAISYFPNQPVLYLYAGSAHFAMNDFKKAIMFWKQGKSIVYGNDRMKSSFAAQLADAYHADKQYEEAFRTYEEAIKSNPLNYFAINNYAYYLSLQKRDLERAKELSSKMVKANPDNATFLDTYGWVLFQKEEYQEALKYLEKAVQNQSSATIIEHYADALYKTGQKEKALEQWKKAKSLGGASELIDKKISEKKYYDASI
ncbi:Tetratricopeptide repeat-containing protein [Marivirga sericea]|uniref:Tetratricopeptide repeat-containing protein n=1 Tax=Marivirga sericea TaxID=1028 RepID=A0A1X7JZF0_9BACT|nr:tetratricopeptide repeat protein [Marivirga sericea]SMG33964.1 Tetratricopeptide repeat-containing protein [Marivirga sericea]